VRRDQRDVDGRDKPGLDDEGVFVANKNAAGWPAALEIARVEAAEKSLLFLVVLLLAADGLEHGERGVDVEVVTLLLARLEFRFFLRGNALRRA
jgi:hypothetical protein